MSEPDSNSEQVTPPTFFGASPVSVEDSSPRPTPSHPQHSESDVATMNAVVAITTELFGPVTVFQDFDPEFADDEFTVLAICSDEDVATISSKEVQWSARVRGVSKNHDRFRLSIRVTQ